MPTNDIHSHRRRSGQISRAVGSLVVPRRSLCSPTTFPTNPGVGGCSLDGGWNPRAQPFVWTKTTDQILAKANRPTTSNADH